MAWRGVTARGRGAVRVRAEMARAARASLAEGWQPVGVLKKLRVLSYVVRVLRVA